MSLTKQDHYATLGVSPTASIQEIKRAYNSLALKKYPDKSKDANTTAAFRKLRRAWDELKVLKKRAAYDSLRRSKEVAKVQAVSMYQTFHEAATQRKTMQEHNRTSWEKHTASQRERERVMRGREENTWTRNEKAEQEQPDRQKDWGLRQPQKVDAKAKRREIRRKIAKNISQKQESRPEQKPNPFIFRLEDFPPEIRDIIFFYALPRTSHQKPALLRALRDYSKLYLDARKVYYRSNSFSYSVLKGSPIDKASIKVLQLMRSITLTIPYINAGTHLAYHVSRACNIQYLTLKGEYDIHIHFVVLHYIPEFTNLKRVKVEIYTRKDRSSQSMYHMPANQNKSCFAKTLNKMLGDIGKIDVVGKTTTWIWEAKGSSFEITRPQTHIKFEA